MTHFKQLTDRRPKELQVVDYSLFLGLADLDLRRKLNIKIYFSVNRPFIAVIEGTKHDITRTKHSTP